LEEKAELISLDSLPPNKKSNPFNHLKVCTKLDIDKKENDKLYGPGQSFRRSIKDTPFSKPIMKKA